MTMIWCFIAAAHANGMIQNSPAVAESDREAVATLGCFV
jgi:hypothetical protein